MTNTEKPATRTELAAALGITLDELAVYEAEGQAFVAATDDLVDVVEVDDPDAVAVELARRIP